MTPVACAPLKQEAVAALQKEGEQDGGISVDLLDKAGGGSDNTGR